MVTLIIVTLAVDLLLTAVSQPVLRHQGPRRQQRRRHLLPPAGVLSLGGVNFDLRASRRRRHRRSCCRAQYWPSSASPPPASPSAPRPPTATCRHCSVCRPGSSRSCRGSAGRWWLAIAGIALASVVISSNPGILFLLSIKGFAAAIVGGMVAFPIAVAAGFGIGLGEEWVRQTLVQENAVLFAGAPEVITLGAVIVVLALRPPWIFKGIREDEDTGVIGRSGGSELLSGPRSSTRSRRTVSCAPRSRPQGRCAPVMRVLRIAVPAGLALFAVAFPFLPLPSILGAARQPHPHLLLVVLSFVVLVGWVGQVVLAQGAFVAVGGAGVAIGSDTLGLPFPLPVVVGVLLSIPVSILIGLPALRLRGLHLVVATLAFGLAAERAILPHFSAGGVRIVRPVLPEHRRPATTSASSSSPPSPSSSPWRIRTYARSAVRSSPSATRDRRHRLRHPPRAGETHRLRRVRRHRRAGRGHAHLPARSVTQLEYASVQFSITWLANAVVGGIGSIAGPVIAALLFGLYPELDQGAVQATSISFGRDRLGRAASADHGGQPGGPGVDDAVRAAPGHCPCRATTRRTPTTSPPSKRPASPRPMPRSWWSMTAILSIDDVGLSFGGVRRPRRRRLRRRPKVGSPASSARTAPARPRCSTASPGFRTPDRGSIVLHGADRSGMAAPIELTARAPWERAGLGVGRTFQNARLFRSVPDPRHPAHRPARRHEAVGLLPLGARAPAALGDRRARGGDACRRGPRAGRAHRARRQAAEELSTGMLRLCELAAVVAVRPRLLLLDEPASGIAQKETEALGPLLRRLARTSTPPLLLIEHDMPLVMGISDTHRGHGRGQGRHRWARPPRCAPIPRCSAPTWAPTA